MQNKHWLDDTYKYLVDLTPSFQQWGVPKFDHKFLFNSSPTITINL